MLLNTPYGVAWGTRDMKRLLLLTVLALLLVACATPAPPATEPTQPATAIPASPTTRPSQPGTGNLAPLPEPTEAAEESPDEELAAYMLSIKDMHPSEVDNSTLPISPVEKLHHTGSPQQYDIDTYRLQVEGLVDTPLSLSYEDLLSRPQVTETVLLICPGFFWDNAEWTGTPLSLILKEAGLTPEAAKVRLIAGDGYAQTLSLEDAMADGVFLAFEVNGETLPTDHGYPTRLVVRHQFGSKWVKWLEKIVVTT